VADELKQFSESLLVISSLLTFCEFEINFCEVHSDCSWGKSFEELVGKVKLDTVAFSCSCGLELSSIDTINIE
jgi:hypothetical protein